MVDIDGVRDLLRNARDRAGLTQSQVAERAGTAQSAVARIEMGRTNPSLETLARLVGASGFEIRLELVPRAKGDPVIEAYKRDIDRTLLARNLEKTAEERVRSLQALVELAEEARRARRVLRESK